MEKEARRHESFIQCDGLIFLVTGIHKIRSHCMLQYNLLFFFVDKPFELNVDKPVEVNVVEL